MINFIDSIGYELEKLHTGMIVYLCDLWRDGQREPLGSFCSSLGIDLQGYEEIEAKREHENIDLVLYDQGENPLLAIEMKVHNHESKVAVKGESGKKDYQTLAYPKRVHDCRRFLFITVGVGEYYHPPYGEGRGGVEWVRLNKFLEAVEAIEKKDNVVSAWAEALNREKEFRRACRCGDWSAIGNGSWLKKKEARNWNLYFLGFLKERLECSLQGLGLDLRVYSHGRADTILNFSEGEHYLEMNQNGRLNLKINLEHLDDQYAKRRYVEKAAQHYREVFSECGTEDKLGEGKLKKSKRILSFDVGIDKRPEGYFAYRQGENETDKQILTLVNRFYERPAPTH